MRNLSLQGQVTGIGSLPHHDPESAVRFVAEYCPVIPFWPQLPQRSDDEIMIPQMLSPLMDMLKRHSVARVDLPSGRLGELCLRLSDVDASFDPSSAAGFFAFERACMTNTFPRAVALKGHISGPITLAHCIFVDDLPLAAFPETVESFTGYLCRLGKWQVSRLARFGEPVIIFIDEPVLGLGAVAPQWLESLQILIDTLRVEGAYVGIHCCASDLPDSIFRLKPDIVSFDAYQGLETVLSGDETRAFVQDGGWLAFGAIPTWEDLSPFDAMQAFMRWVNAGEDRYDLPELASHSLITATCGLGLLPVESAAASF